MEIFISILIIALLLGIVIVILRSPKEIAGNLLKYIFRTIFLPFYWIYAIFQTTREENKKVDSLKSGDSDLTATIHLEDSGFYLLIKGSFPLSEIEADISNELQKLQVKSVTHRTFDLGNNYLTEVNGDVRFFDCYQLISNLRELYGIDGTFGYLIGPQSQVTMKMDVDDPFLMVGQLKDGRNYFYEPLSAETRGDAVFISSNIELPPWLKPDFFNHLIKNVYENEHN